MKTWKKLSLLLCLCIAFSSVATACDPDKNDSSSSNSPENSSSSGVEDSSSSVEDEDDTDIMLDLYLGLAATTAMNSKSAKITFEITNNGMVETGALATSTTWKMMSGEAVFTKTDDGFNARIDADVTSLENPAQIEKKSYYILDGYAYEYFAATNTYDKYEESLESLLSNGVHSATQGQYTLTTLLGAVMGVLENSGGSDMTLEGLEGALDGMATVKGGLTDNSAWIKADATAEADELFDFLRTVDENTTYGELVNFALKQISPDLTLTVILDEIYAHRNSAVGSMVEEFNEKSLEKTGKSLQQNLDVLLANTAVQEAIKSAFEENTELADKILKFKIDDFLKEDSAVQDAEGGYVKNGDLTLNDLSKELVKKLVETLGEDNELLNELGLITDNVNVTLIIGAVEAMAEWKAFENIEEGSAFYELLEQAKTIEISQADVKLEIVPEVNQIASVAMVGVLTGNRTKEGTTYAVSAMVTLEISQFSKEGIVIALPAGATLNALIYGACADCQLQKEGVAYREDVFGYYCEECYAALFAQPEVTE